MALSKTETLLASEESAALAVSSSRSPAFREAIANTFLTATPKAKLVRKRLSYEPPRRVAVFSNDGPVGKTLCAHLKALRYIPLMLDPTYRLTDTWHATFSRFAQIVFVDIDAIAEKSDPIDFCQTLRAEHPLIPMILMSHGFRNHDLSTERSKLGDASITISFDRAFLQKAIGAAVDNNLSMRLSSETARN